MTFSNSIVLITSSTVGHKRTFGTGFVIDQSLHITYVITCDHVVKQMGGDHAVEVDGRPAEVIASGREFGFDLTILKVLGLAHRDSLQLNPSGDHGSACIIQGFYEFDTSINPVLRSIQATLGEVVELRSQDGRKTASAWDLNLKESYNLRPGYSGSPVVNIKTGSALGVVTHQVGNGKLGLAISIGAIAEIWSEIPDKLWNNLKIFETSHFKPMLNDAKIIPSLDPFREKKLEIIKKDIAIATQKEQNLSEEIAAISSELDEIQGSDSQLRLNRRMERLQRERDAVIEKLDQLFIKQSQI
jgi:hypothetical protein